MDYSLQTMSIYRDEHESELFDVTDGFSEKARISGVFNNQTWDYSWSCITPCNQLNPYVLGNSMTRSKLQCPNLDYIDYQPNDMTANHIDTPQDRWFSIAIEAPSAPRSKVSQFGQPGIPNQYDGSWQPCQAWHSPQIDEISHGWPENHAGLDIHVQNCVSDSTVPTPGEVWCIDSPCGALPRPESGSTPYQHPNNLDNSNQQHTNHFQPYMNRYGDDSISDSISVADTARGPYDSQSDLSIHQLTMNESTPSYLENTEVIYHSSARANATNQSRLDDHHESMISLEHKIHAKNISPVETFKKKNAHGLKYKEISKKTTEVRHIKVPGRIYVLTIRGVRCWRAEWHDKHSCKRMTRQFAETVHGAQRARLNALEVLCKHGCVPESLIPDAEAYFGYWTGNQPPNDTMIGRINNNQQYSYQTENESNDSEEYKENNPNANFVSEFGGQALSDHNKLVLHWEPEQSEDEHNLRNTDSVQNNFKTYGTLAPLIDIRINHKQQDRVLGH